MKETRSEMICRPETLFPGMMETPGYYDYARQVYDYLEVMEPGTILKLQAPEDKLPWLLVTVGIFLAASDHWMDYETDDDYTKLRKKSLPENFRKAMYPKV